MADHKRLCTFAMQLTTSVYRILVLENKVPLIIWSNPEAVHFQFSVVHLDDVVATYVKNKSITLFLVDSLNWSLSMTKAVKLILYVSIIFYQKGKQWLHSIIQMDRKKMLDAICDIVPKQAFHDIQSVKLSIRKIGNQQQNGFDCGIFCIMQMHRLSSYLLGNKNIPSFMKGSTLTESDIRECLLQRIVRQDGPNISGIDQNSVLKWRIAEFMYLLSLWIRTLHDMGPSFEEKIAALNHADVDTKGLKFTEDIPYSALTVDDKLHLITSVESNKLTIQSQDGNERQVLFNDVKFKVTPTPSEMTKKNFNKICIKHDELTKMVVVAPSVVDLARFFPFHTKDEDKFISGDYVLWKTHILDKRGKQEGIARPKLAVDSMNVMAAHKLMERKRKRNTQESATIDLL